MSLGVDFTASAMIGMGWHASESVDTYNAVLMCQASSVHLYHSQSTVICRVLAVMLLLLLLLLMMMIAVMMLTFVILHIVADCSVMTATRHSAHLLTSLVTFAVDSPITLGLQRSLRTLDATSVSVSWSSAHLLFSLI